MPSQWAWERNCQLEMYAGVMDGWLGGGDDRFTYFEDLRE